MNVAHRSPILGYNHNISYRGLVFHVQTEDSGVTNPHIYTHLFHEGVILSTRKLEYSAEASDDVVKSLMQAQHRAVLKDLKRGEFDDKIDSYLGGHPDLLPADSERRANSAEIQALVSSVAGDEEAPLADEDNSAIPTARRAGSDVSAAFQAIQLPREDGEPPDLEPTSHPATRPSDGHRDGGRKKPRRRPTPITPAPPPVTSVGPAVHLPAPASTRTTRRTGRIPRRERTQPGVGRGSPIRPTPPPVAKSESEPAASAGHAEPAGNAQPRNAQPQGNVLISQPPIVVDSHQGPARQRTTTPVSPIAVNGSAAGADPVLRTVRPEPGGPHKDGESPPPSPIPPEIRSGRRAPAPPVSRGPTMAPRRSSVPRRPPVRKVRENNAADGIFDQNLISEKSLDEVILAYLSEDGSDE
ncbi:MAG: hypothetical protein MJE77_43465 [Proteobacteria bacterium]|nr:hypothetical protein [Pseudomonadota bacterium]